MGGIEAQSGFYYQNVVGALRALDLIELGSPLVSVSFDNPNKAESIDDIVAEGVGFAEFTQVKWAEDVDSTFTLANLTSTDESNSKSLLRKIADGFRQIQNLDGTKRVILFSTRGAGTNTLPSKGFHKSLDSFITEFQTPFRQDPLNRELENALNYSSYKDTLEILYAQTGFKDWASFASFLRSLHFELAQPDRETQVLRLKMRLAKLGIPESFYSQLTNKVVEWSIDRVNVRADDVLRELSLKDRFVDSLRQNFPVDIERLVPVPYLAEAIDVALTSLPSGYILLQGEPGVGKSTALTTLGAYRRDITFEYFCFIPNERSVGNQRLDADSFVRSLCIGLRNAFPDLQFPQTFSELTKATLNSWLNFLSGQGKRVILVVDGLDHVDTKHRQGVLEHPMTGALDGVLPSGIFMILGSQYIEALPMQVQDELKSDDRRLIKVRRFDEAETQDFFRRRHITLSAENLSRAQEISGGVPIYLEYLASALSGLHGFEQTHFLESAPSLRDNKIDAYHDHLWHAVERDQIAAAILSLLAIRQDFTTVEDLLALLRILEIEPTRPQMEQSLKTIAHVLRVSDAQGYAIRHESFRLYVEAKTSLQVDRLNEALHRWYADHPETNEAWRHRFRHLYELGFYKEILEACTDDWLRKGWAQYRPFAEINDNIDFAWRAAADLRDLTQFVRIALMRQRVSLVKENLGREEAEIGLILLELNHPQEALLRVWDGERAISGQLAFARFCLNHQKLLKRPPSLDVMRQGLGEKLPSGVSSDGHQTYYRACTNSGDPIALLERTAHLSWTRKNDAKSEVVTLSPQQSSVVNWRIAASIIDELYTSQKTTALLEISDSQTIDSEVRRYAALAAATLLNSAGERSEAANLLAESKPVSLPREETTPYFITLAEQGISISALLDVTVKPQLPGHLINPRSYTVDDDLLNVYDRLRLFFFIDADARQWFNGQLADLPSELKSLLSALATLAELWVKRTKQEEYVCTAETFADRANELLQVRRQLLNSDSPTVHFDQELPEFLQFVWDEATKVLDTEQLTKFAVAWMKLRSESSLKPPAQTTRGLALSLARHLSSGEQILADLLGVAEADARLEEETAVLSSELLATASAWARAGFPQEADRLWNELMDVACGIYYRKDYQFNEILLPMELAHNQDPPGSVARISEQLVLAHQLEDAARSKTIAVAIEDLIAFSTKVSPSFSLEILFREDGNVFRERAIKDLIRALLSIESIDPKLLWALSATMSVWENYQHFSDETAPALTAVFEACLERRLTATATAIYQQARQLFLVQKDMPGLLGSWAHSWVEAGDVPDDVRADCDRYWSPKTNSGENSLLDLELEPNDVQKLDEAIKIGIPELEKELDRLEDWSLRRARHGEIEQLRNEWCQRIETILDRKFNDQELAAFHQGFNALEENLLAISETNQMKVEQIVRQALSDFLSQFEKQTGVTSSLRSSLTTYSLDSWLNRFLHQGSARYTTERVLKRKLPGWIADFSFRKLPELIDFCRRRCWNDLKGEALSAIAKRYAAVDRETAFALLVEARQSTAELFFLHNQLARTVLDQAVSLDSSRGIKLLFDSFREHHQRYPQNIVHSLGGVVRFHSEFLNTNFVELYQVWSGYNRTLAAGLSAKSIDVSYLQQPVPSTFIDGLLLYLVRMFDYPDVDVRLLAANACLGLLADGTLSRHALLQMWPELNMTQREQLVSILFSDAMARPEKVDSWVLELLQLVEAEVHLNLRRSTADLVFAADTKRNLSPSILQQATELTKRHSGDGSNGGLAV